LATRAAGSDAPILLRGENGTGKSTLARLIHARSKRVGKPYVTVSCPTLPEELLASELFGHAIGAFTGAVRDQAGRVEAAESGTLLLDEIGEISPALQAPRLGGDFTLDQIEREHIERVAGRTATLDDAAKILGIDASTLYRKRKKYEG
jgi:transcriptional regulator with PAS, ATPase and Fis domain